MLVHLLVLALLVFTSTAQYDDWKVYKGLDPDNVNRKKYVMYQSAKLNAKLHELNSGAGIHVSVYPKTGIWDPYVPGHDIHSSWNIPAGSDRENNFHWGYTKDGAVHGKWYQDTKLEHLKQNARLAKKNRHKIPTQEQLGPLKEAFDAFVKGKIIGDDGKIKKKDGKPIDIWEFPDQKIDVTKIEISNKFPAAAHEDYDNYYYDNHNDNAYNTKQSRSYPQYIHHQHANNEDTDSSSINVPTVVVTLISCMFLFVLCVLYTGCIGIVAGAIGYKVKESQQVHKEHSFQEI